MNHGKRLALFLTGMTVASACGQTSEAPPDSPPAPDPSSTDLLTETQSPPASCAEPAPGPAPLRRLSNFEYRNTLADLTGDQALAALATGQLVREPTSLGFRNSASALTIPSLLAEQYVQIAVDVAHQAMDRPGWFPCSLDTISQQCTQDFVESFGKRVYRRPLVREEIERYSVLYNNAIEREGDYRKAIEWVVATLLSSPHFLFRVELDPQNGQLGRPNGYEMAQRLSYLLWQTMPDAELFRAADAGELESSGAVVEQARRMLADPKAYRVYEFFEQWLDLDELESVTRNTTMYPEYTPELRARFSAETKAFVYDLLANGGTLKDLFAAEYTFADAELARHYGLPSAGLGTTFEKVSAPGRSGVLTQPRLIVHDHPASTSIVRRGLKLRTDLLCQVIPAPPADVDVTPPVIDGTVTQKQRLEEHRSDPSCSGCHALMDPVGTIFEDFDALGRKRSTDEGGAPVDPGGELLGSRDADGFYGSAQELGRALAGSTDARECIVRQAFRFFYGRELDASDQCTARQIMAGFERRNYRLDDLILTLTLSDQFLFRDSDTAEEATP